MRNQFPLFQSHLDLAHDYWRRLVRPGDCVIDATCGNGFDTLVLAQLALTGKAGSVYALDVLDQAVDATRARLSAELSPEALRRIALCRGCHSQFPSEIAPGSVKLIVYNLGYLPGGDKARTTLVWTTLLSIEKALSLLAPGGCISVTAYPGHEEGQLELQSILDFASALDPKEWSCCQHHWLNRSASPRLILIQRFNQPTT